jgi:hypothetical protein
MRWKRGRLFSPEVVIRLSTNPRSRPEAAAEKNKPAKCGKKKKKVRRQG